MAFIGAIGTAIGSFLGSSAVAGAAALGGLALSAVSLSQSGKSSSSAGATTTPTQEDAAATAKASLRDRRRSILATGGQTDLTQGTALLSSTSTQKRTLLG